MRVHQCFREITPAAVRELVKHYDSLLPVVLEELDQERYVNIPATIARRCDDQDTANKGESGAPSESIESPFITRDELVTLVKWKLYSSSFWH